MPAMPKTVHVEVGSELGQLLDTAAENDILLEMDGVRFRLNRVDTPTPTRTPSLHRPLVPERVLNIIGLGASAQGSDVARLKDQYIADAAFDREV
jgi:hypothetical protein